MSGRLLIANRGEIALRILRACHHAGLETVAIYTEVDRNLPHLKQANAQVKVSGYLNIDDVVMAAKTKGCDSVHPGYGLLSENAEFAQKVESAGLTFIGPTSEHISMLGDKLQARRVFQKLGIPTIPGSEGAVESAEEVRAIAEQVGYPLVIKASFGGGGRGIRAVHNENDLDNVLHLSRGEAGISFGKDEVFVEKLLVDARHIEVQILGDGHGQCVHLGTRDCSVQRRYQKLIEEAPAPQVDSILMNLLTDQCIQAMSEIHYRNAATLEFLFTDDKFFFLEVNTRLQVEHPVTEMVSGQDIVALQLHIAEKGSLPIQQEEVMIQGSAIECRILAEDQSELPSPGIITHFVSPGGPGVRMDTHIFTGYEVPHQYDSLIAKLVVLGSDRLAALARMRQALRETKIEGISTNIKNLQQLIDAEAFVTVKHHTNWTLK